MLAPVPTEVTTPGYRINVHIPVEGNPLRITLPVDKKHDGGVIVPIKGAGGVTGGAAITILPEGEEIHPNALVTVKVYVPSVRFDTVVLVPVPVVVIPPGERVSVQVPINGNPDKTTLPVGTEQVG